MILVYLLWVNLLIIELFNLLRNLYNVNFDLIMLAYPVVSSDNSIWHKGSFENLLGNNIENKVLLNRLSLEYEVTSEAPKLFLWSTFEDKSVNVLNTITLASVYKMNGVDVELHIFPYGVHGLSVADKYSAEGNKEKNDSYIAKWILLANEWIKKNI